MSRKRRGIMRTNPTRCHYCRRQFPTEELTEDHVVPRARGGLNRIWNIVAACESCNNRKADSWPTCQCEFCRNSVERHYTIVSVHQLHPSIW